MPSDVDITLTVLVAMIAGVPIPGVTLRPAIIAVVEALIVLKDSLGARGHSYGVALRAGEIGIRRALGAQEGTVVTMVLRQGLVLATLGLALGVGAAALGGRVLEGFLHEVSPTDPRTYLAVSLGVLLVASLATWLPARRASGVDPLEALRVQ